MNPRINAVVRFADDATAQARAADAVPRGDARRGPLHGVPFTIKDSLDTAGIVTTAGTVGWATRIPDRDATVVARLKAAGGILLGKTNTPELTWSNDADNLVYGRTSNPYDLDRSPGGSSGGSAAIVAAGGSPFDIGSDTGDSIRQPSHVCGMAGLKPTSGRVPRTGHSPSFRGILESLTQLGPIARRVEDLALLLPIIAGPDGIDPHVAAVPLRDPAEVDVRSLRIAWFDDDGRHSPTPEIKRTVTRPLTPCAIRCATSERLPPDQGRASDLWNELVDADGHAWLRRLIAAAGTPGAGSYEGRADWVTESTPLAGDDLTALVEAVDDVRSVHASLDGRRRSHRQPGAPARRPAPRRRMTDVFQDGYSEVHNLTGWPAAVVRGRTSPEGLPIGVQLIAAPWREDVALAAAAVVEAALGGWQPPPL